MTTTTEAEGILTPLAVVPKHDVHPLAYIVTAENLLEVGARLGLNVLATTHRATLGRPLEFLEIPPERRYNLASEARPGDVIVRHPVTVRDLETMPLATFEQQYQPADTDLLDTMVRQEFPDAHAWAIIASGPAGVHALPGNGIVDAAHLIGIATLVARAGRPRS